MLLVVSEEEFNVETSCVAVDFSVGRDTYSLIWDSIKDKEIGVLGKLGFKLLSRTFPCIVLKLL